MISLLLLADSRLPSGGHGHSGGIEALVDRGLVRSVDDLALFLDGRVRTGGRVVAASAAAACALASAEADWARWDAAVSARIPSAALRAASRAQGAALLRTVTLAFPCPAVSALRALPRVHHPLVLGAAAAAARAEPVQAAALALHHLVGGASAAAVRLLGLDPLRVAAVAAAIARTADPVAAAAAALAAAAVAVADPALLPTEGSPLTDVLAELHRASEATLFAS
jgi:urease accessory protein